MVKKALVEFQAKQKELEQQLAELQFDSKRLDGNLSDTQERVLAARRWISNRKVEEGDAEDI